MYVPFLNDSSSSNGVCHSLTKDTTFVWYLIGSSMMTVMSLPRSVTDMNGIFESAFIGYFRIYEPSGC